jgi:hypothetical protein
MTRFMWDGVPNEGENLFEALKLELKNARNSEYTIIGKQWQKEYEDDCSYYCSEDTDDDYKEYCDTYGVAVPVRPDESPRCGNCHHQLMSRYSWAENQASCVYEGDWVKELSYSFEDVNNNEEVGKRFNIDPIPVEAYDEEKEDWIPYTVFIAKKI